MPKFPVQGRCAWVHDTDLLTQQWTLDRHASNLGLELGGSDLGLRLGLGLGLELGYQFVQILASVGIRQRCYCPEFARLD